MRNNRVSGELEKGVKDSERQDRSDRFNFRNRATDSDGTANDRFRDRDGRNNFRRRGDQDQDSEGWSTVKPRKSFGTEGAERFHGRMGAAGTERFGARDDRRARDKEDRDVDRRSRNLDGHVREKDDNDTDGPRRNGLARGKSEPWFRDAANDGGNGDAPVSQRERIEKAKSWRDRDPEAGDRRAADRGIDRNYDHRWDRGGRDQRVEREPEWLDEPLEEKSHGHTEEDFKKFMESMKAKQGGAAPTKPEEAPSALPEKPAADILPDTDLKMASAPAVESGPDKFFVAFGGTTLTDPATPAVETKEAARSKAPKSSRFMAFLNQPEDSRARTEPPTPAGAAQAGGATTELPPQNDTEKEAFALLIQKLQRSGVGPMQNSGPPPQSLARLFEQVSVQEPPPKSSVASPEPFQQYGGGDHREDPRLRAPPPQHPIHGMISPRQMVPPTQPPPVSRPEQALQDLLAQRHNVPSQSNNRGPQGNNLASNTEFLMRLMQSHREASEPAARPELQVRMPQPTKQVSVANIPDRELDYQRERSASQRQQHQLQQQAQQQQQQMRLHQGPPGFLDDHFHSPDADSRPQPTQILQRPPPPGLDHHAMHPFQMGGAGAGGPGVQMPPPQRPMIPPPGLVGGPRNPNVALPGMYPNTFPPPGPVFGAPPPPPLEGLGGVPPGPMSRMLPPPGFYGGVPPGFLPPAPPGMSPGGFQGGPDGPGPFPFDRRGMLPPGYRGP